MWSFKPNRTPALSGLSLWLLAAVWIAVCVGSLGAVTQSQAQQLLPADRDEIADQERLSWTLQKFPAQPYMNEIYWQYPKDTPAFFRDSLVQYVARTYYLTRDNFDGSKSQAWRKGAGWHFDRVLSATCSGCIWPAIPRNQFSLRSIKTARSCCPLVRTRSACSGRSMGAFNSATRKFAAVANWWTRPSSTPKTIAWCQTRLKATTLVSLPDKDRNYDYSVGYLWNIKQRDSNDFISMSDALAGSDVINHGAAFGMIKFRPISGLSLTAMDYNVQDTVNTAFAQAEYDFKQPKGVPNWIIGANIIDQQSIGADLLTGTPFETYQASAKAQMVYAGWTLFVAGSITGDGSNIFSPYGTKPNYTDMQQASFDNAGEKAFGGSVAYDFGCVRSSPDLVPAPGIRRAGAPSTPAPIRQSPTGMSWTFGYNTVPRKAR